MDIKQVYLCKLDDCNGDLTKDWFLYFSYRDPRTNRMERIRIYKGFAALKTDQERRDHYDKLKREYDHKLRTGWNPLRKENVLYQSDLLTQSEARFESRDRVADFSIEHLMDMFLKSSKHNLVEKSFQCYTSRVRFFLKWLRAVELETIAVEKFTRQQGNQFIIHALEKRSTKTVKTYVDLLHAFFEWLMVEFEEQRLILKNPFDNTIKFKVVSKKTVPYKRSEIEDLRAMLFKEDQQLWLFVGFIFYTMIRPKELRLLQLQNIDLQRETIFIPAAIAKNKMDCTIELPTHLKDDLLFTGVLRFPEENFIFSYDGIPGTKPLGKNHMANRWKKLREKMDLPDHFKNYTWKYTGNIEALNAGIPAPQLQRQNRHASLDQFISYTQGGSINMTQMKTLMPKI